MTIIITITITGLKWNEKKCAVIHVKTGQVQRGSGPT